MYTFILATYLLASPAAEQVILSAPLVTADPYVFRPWIISESTSTKGVN